MSAWTGIPAHAFLIYSVMKRHFEKLSRRAGRMIRHWWLMLLVGILVIIAGILVFVFPAQSYFALGVLFGILMLLSGAAQLVIAGTSGNYLVMRSYVVIGGVVDLLLGLFLCIYPGVTMVVLPVFLGIWMLYHSFIIIAFGGDMDTFRIPDGGLVVIGGILLLLLSIMILINPLGTGVETVLLLTGIGIIIFGALLCVLSMKMRDMHRYFDAPNS